MWIFAIAFVGYLAYRGARRIAAVLRSIPARNADFDLA